MKLVYIRNGQRVKAGDKVTLTDGKRATVKSFTQPRSKAARNSSTPAFEGNVTVLRSGVRYVYRPFAIGAEWIDD